jgi:hypothetical protein
MANGFWQTTDSEDSTGQRLFRTLDERTNYDRKSELREREKEKRKEEGKKVGW